METPDSLREFWFGTDANDSIVAKGQSKLWWIKDAALDRQIGNRFGSYLHKASNGDLSDWLASPSGRLALVLITDQFPRNIFRDTPQAFAYDALARAWCKEGIDNGAHVLLRPIERAFFYLPLEHSELAEDQERSLALYHALARSVEPDQRATFNGFLRSAIHHHEIVLRFHRFPHRNKVLGRASTPEELAFLEQPGSSF